MNQRPTTAGRSLGGLLEAAARGDREAFRALYEATAPKLFAVLLRILRNRPVAEEVLQETYVRIWQNAERFAPEAGEPMAWMTAIARNRAIDRIRTDKVHQAGTTDDSVLERLAAPAAGDPATHQALRRCLDGLEQDARDCVVLAYCWGYSREELAERFERPVGTIKTLLYRSMRLLKTCLEQE